MTSPATPGESKIRTLKPEPAPLLLVENLRVELPVGGSLRAAVDGVSLSLSAGESVAVVGESGCGKTQLLRAILGLAPEGGRLSGRIAFEGRDLLRLSDRQWRRVRGAGIGLVFQEPASALDPVRTIGEQIVESLRLHRRLSRGAARRLASAALREVGFPDPEAGLDEYAHRLSGGLRQRALLAAALAPGPRLLLADEPTASLDATVAAQVLTLFDRLRRERGLTLLLVTHDLGVVARHCDRVLVLYAGRAVEEAHTADLFSGACHPYTRGLLRSMPRLRTAGSGLGRRFETIPGTLEDLALRRAGACAFAPRCGERFDPCDRREPAPYRTPIGEARCFLYEPAAGGASP